MQVIDSTLNALRTRVGEIETDIQTRRDGYEAEIKPMRDRLHADLEPREAELHEIAGMIRAIERQQARVTNAPAGRSGTPRNGGNHDRILAAIREPKRVNALAEETGIGAGSLNRSLKRMQDNGEARKTAAGWVAITDTSRGSASK